MLLLAGGFLALLIFSSRADAASTGQLTGDLTSAAQAATGDSPRSGDAAGALSPVAGAVDQVRSAAAQSAATQPVDQGAQAVTTKVASSTGTSSRPSTTLRTSTVAGTLLGGSGATAPSKRAATAVSGLTAKATKAAAPVTSGLGSAVSPVTSSLGSAVSPATTALAPASGTALGVVAPVAGAAGAGPLPPPPSGPALPTSLVADLGGPILSALLGGPPAATAEGQSGSPPQAPAAGLRSTGASAPAPARAWLSGAVLPEVRGLPGSGGRAPSMPFPLQFPAAPAAEGSAGADSLSGSGRAMSGAGAAAVPGGLLLLVLWLSSRRRLEGFSPTSLIGLRLERPG